MTLEILDLVGDDISESDVQKALGKALKKAEPEEYSDDEGMLQLAFQEYKDAKDPKEGLEAMRFLVSLMSPKK